MVFDYNILDQCYISKYIYGTKRTKVEVYASFYYSIGPLHLSGFKMNLIADSNKLQFCWKLKFLLL